MAYPHTSPNQVISSYNELLNQTFFSDDVKNLISNDNEIIGQLNDFFAKGKSISVWLNDAFKGGNSNINIISDTNSLNDHYYLFLIAHE